MRLKTLLAASLALVVSCPSVLSPVMAATPVAPTANPDGTEAKTESQVDDNLEPSKNKYKAEYQEIETLLGEIENQWNSHSLDNVMKFYADDYVNNDGLDKKAVLELTRDFWKTYPDAKSFSKTKQIRVEGKFATVESRDRAVGTTATELRAVQSKGVLTSISEGQLYLKKINKTWKIIGDRIDYEKVRVAFGLAKDLQTSFIAPEQVKSGQEYSARLNVDLPTDLIAVGSITNEPLQYPQPPNKDNPLLGGSGRPLDNRALERIVHANTSNHNELLTATIAIIDRSRSNLKGLTYLTRRLNVVPDAKQYADEKTEAATSVEGEIMMKGVKDSPRDDESGTNGDTDSQSDKDQEQGK